MSKSKYYAVRVGRKTGIYRTWDECLKEVHGYPNAEYKSFKTRDAATSYLSNKNEPLKKVISKIEKKEKPKVTLTNAYIEGILRNSLDTTVNAFVDGSYDKMQDKYSYGAFLIYAGNEISMKKAFDDEEGIKYHNFSGEIKGAMKAISWAIENEFKRINLFYDYEGIEKFATGEYKKANNPISKEYQSFILQAKREIWITFFKIKSHSNIKYNDKADELAKEALNI